MDLKQYHSLLRDRILVFDGAMGTSLQKYNPTLDDYEGKEGCSEILCFTRPQWIKDIHASFLDVGCDFIETNSFGSNAIVLAEYELADKVFEYNKTSAELAKEVARSFSTPEKPRFVAGSMGPGTKLPSLGHTTFDILRTNYREQAKGLIAGGSDLLLIETCQDLLQVKAAINGSLDAMKDLKTKIPLHVQVTIEATGSMLVGSDMATAITVIECFPVDAIGLNCATGPTEMSEHVRTLSQNSNRYLTVLPNAGLPENVGGQAVYKLTPDELASHLQDFIKRFGVNVVGGCCGTTPEHLKKVSEMASGLSPTKRNPKSVASAASLYLSVPLRQEPAPMIIGERTNANGSKKFRDLLSANDYDALVSMAKEQERESVHTLDVCAAYVGRDEVADMKEIISRFVLQTRVPLVIDSTEAPVIEESLKLIGGKPIVNSINLEDGEDRLEKICPMLKTYGAAVIALTIDEQGMAKTAKRKFDVAKRLYDLAVDKYGIPPSDIIFDALTFTLGSGDEEFRKAGIETIEGIKQIKAAFPEVHTTLGVSNISFGLSPAAREVLNSVFLHYAIEAGLDSAIVNYKKIKPYFKIEEKGRELAKALVFDERQFDSTGKCTFDPLTEFMAHYQNASAIKEREKVVPKNVEEDLKNRIIDGNKQGIEPVLDKALKKYPALEIINKILLAGMKVVGELFGSGQIQLPFVLQSAETMKAAVRHLEPHIPKVEGQSSKGVMVLATVKGDVHDIGKNLVDIILTNNGYKVVNLGIKQPIENIIKAAEEHKPHAIGLSGLLVKSTAIMKENLEELNVRQLPYNIVLGGAALTKKFVEVDLRSLYKGKVFYANDAFDGLGIMDELTHPETEKRLTGAYEIKEGKPTSAAPEEAKEPVLPMAERIKKGKENAGEAPRIPEPPFWGSRVIRGITMEDVFPYMNETALIKVRWGFKRTRNVSLEQYNKTLEERAYPAYEKWKNIVLREKIFNPQIVYGYFPCQSEGNDLVVFDDQGEKERVRFTFPRMEKEPYHCIADFFLPVGSNQKDVLSMMVVTIGQEATDYIQKIYKNNEYSDYLFAHGLSVETAEAMAEYWHRRVREELDITGEDASEVRRYFQQAYQGSRYSFGYPACPNLEDQTQMFELLDPKRIGVSLTEEFQLDPEQTTSAIIVHHPKAKYFSV